MHTPFRLLLFRAVSIAMGLALSSCAVRREVDFRSFEKAPTAMTSNLSRCVAKVCPPMKHLLYYGNYGGLGQKGGEPVDAMDDLFRRHDMCYYLGGSLNTLYQSDAALIAGLEALDPSNLDERGQKYRLRAIKYFSSPMAKVVGKPVFLVLKRKNPEPVEGPLEEPGSVARLFDPNLPGFPPGY